MGKTGNLYKKIRDTKGTFHAKMGTIKERNGKDLKKQKRLRTDGKNTQTILKYLNDLDNNDGSLTYVTHSRSLTQSQPSWSVKSSGP